MHMHKCALHMCECMFCACVHGVIYRCNIYAHAFMNISTNVHFCAPVYVLVGLRCHSISGEDK